MQRIISDNRHNSSFKKNLREKAKEDMQTYGVDKVAAKKRNATGHR